VTRVDKIIAHLKAKGAQYVPEFDMIVTDQFWEHVFRNLTHSVRVREWRNGSIEIFVIGVELCGGMAREPFDKMPEMDWLLHSIDESTSAYPPEVLTA